MRKKHSISKLLVVFFIYILFNNSLLAQKEIGVSVQEKDSTYIHHPDIFNLNRIDNYKQINQTLDISLYYENNANKNPFIFINPANRSNNFYFNQQHHNIEFPGLGSSKWFNNQFIWEAGNNVSVGLETGLAIQNTVFDPFLPSFQYTLGITLEYAFNERLKAYFFGQYVSNPLNKPKDYFDPLLYGNSMFLQTETGFGIKSSIKNTLIDFRISSGYNQQFKSTNNFNSKLNIRF